MHTCPPCLATSWLDICKQWYDTPLCCTKASCLFMSGVNFASGPARVVSGQGPLPQVLLCCSPWLGEKLWWNSSAVGTCTHLVWLAWFSLVVLVYTLAPAHWLPGCWNQLGPKIPPPPRPLVGLCGLGQQVPTSLSPLLSTS